MRALLARLQGTSSQDAEKKEGDGEVKKKSGKKSTKKQALPQTYTWTRTPRKGRTALTAADMWPVCVPSANHRAGCKKQA